ncbi:MAG: cobyric acid synthase [Alphaproteobacteria bacterium]
MRPAALMLQGTGSDVGKSLLIAGLARAFTRRGLSVRPFKPQNMSNNAAVTDDGGEIGRAQALQARASRVPSSVHMNPVLLKPQSETGAQVVVQGKVWGAASARDYHRLKPALMDKVMECFAALSARADLVLVEGAGSPAEVNLRAGDIANMGFAEAADLPVLLVGDVDRGGVIAAVVGTWTLLAGAERAHLKGYVVNKFRGDPGLFDGAIRVIGDRTGLECLGLVPYLAEASRLPAEDAAGLNDRLPAPAPNGRTVRVAVPRLSRLANFDDLDPLTAEPDVAVEWVPPGRALPGDADLVVLTGTKATLADLAFLRAQGWDIDIRAHLRRGGWLVGLCGGYQMLGERVSDPLGLEGRPGETQGLGLLEVTTELRPEKRLARTSGVELSTGEVVRGYEMHMGVTEGVGLARPVLDLGGRKDGARSQDGRVLGCYLHGLFAADRFRHAFLTRVAGRASSGIAYEADVERALDAVADRLESCLNLDRILEIADGR